MSNSKDPQPYLMAAGGLAILAGGITYCATNWDEPPEWWPKQLQPWWNKKDSEPKQTNDFVKHEDEEESTNEPTDKLTTVKYVEPVTPVKPDKIDAEPTKEENPEVTSDKKDLGNPSDIDVKTN